MASRKRERVVDMAEAIATGLAVVPADLGAGAATGAVSVRADVGPVHHVVPAAHSDSGGPATFHESEADFATAVREAMGAGPGVRVSFDGAAYHFDPPLNPALASDPGGWCVHAADWIGGRPVIARDAAGGALCGLTEAEARLAVRVLGSGFTAAREA